MEWAREIGQQCMMLKIDFNKAYDQVERSFICKMMTYLSFGSCCVDIVNILFFDTLTFVSVNRDLSP